ncbi:MAG: gliding motility protein GldC [Cryomorphaceae bacterium]|nr:gliding motility protein GldC [Flavobacteriales bacterium]
MKKEVKKQTEIRIDVGLDENHVPIDMKWEASDGGGNGECKAVMLAMWDRKEENAMRIDLWDKEMSIFDMQRFFHQTFMTMGDTYERATGKKPEADEIRSFARKFAEKAGIMG